MSSGALFGNNASRSTSKNLVEFKAGKMTMKGNVVYPDTRKGQLYVYQSDDSLMHFCWKDRTTGVVEDDLIIFPDDCEFKHVPQCKTGRVYLLRFKSSSKKLFVWLQDLKTDKDEENCRKINEVLNNPPAPGSQRNEGDIQNLLNNMSQQQLMQLFGGVGRIGSLGSLDSILGTMNRPYTLQTIMSSPRNAMRNVARASSPLAYSSEFESHSIPESQCTADGHSTSDSSRKTDSQSASKTQGKSESQGSSKSAEKSESQTTSESNNESESNRRTSATPVTTSGKSIPQTGQTGPIIRQFGFGPEVINAATTGNVEQFINALESEAKTGQEQPQDGQKDKDAKQSSPATKPDKKDDDDEGMALD